MYLDKHFNASTYRAEPLLAYLEEHPQTLVTPIIDKINKNDLQYLPENGKITVGFAFDMSYQWMQISPRLQADKSTIDPME